MDAPRKRLATMAAHTIVSTYMVSTVCRPQLLYNESECLPLRTGHLARSP